MSSEFELYSPLTVPDAMARLRENVGGDIPLLMLPTSEPDRSLRGWVGDREFAVRLRTTYGNAFAAVARGAIEPSSSGSIIRGYMGMSFATGFGLFLWTFGVLFFGMQAITRRDSRSALEASAMLAFGVGLVAFGRVLARKEGHRIASRLSEILQAASRAPAA